MNWWWGRPSGGVLWAVALCAILGAAFATSDEGEDGEVDEDEAALQAALDANCQHVTDDCEGTPAWQKNALELCEEQTELAIAAVGDDPAHLASIDRLLAKIDELYANPPEGCALRATSTETREVLDADGNPVLDADGNPVREAVPGRLLGWREILWQPNCLTEEEKEQDPGLVAAFESISDDNLSLRGGRDGESYLGETPISAAALKMECLSSAVGTGTTRGGARFMPQGGGGATSRPLTAAELDTCMRQQRQAATDMYRAGTAEISDHTTINDRQEIAPWGQGTTVAPIDPEALAFASLPTDAAGMESKIKLITEMRPNPTGWCEGDALGGTQVREPDLAHKVINHLFGGFIWTYWEDWQGATTGPDARARACSPPNVDATLLTKGLGFTNIIALLLGVVIVWYVVVGGAINTAKEGRVFGKDWDTLWMPLRNALSFGLITPATIGAGVLSLAQVMIIWLLIFGSNAATALWTFVVLQAGQGTQIHAVRRGAPVALVKDVFLMMACARGMEGPADEEETVRALARPYSRLKQDSAGGGGWGMGSPTDPFACALSAGRVVDDPGNGGGGGPSQPEWVHTVEIDEVVNTWMQNPNGLSGRCRWGVPGAALRLAP